MTNTETLTGTTTREHMVGVTHPTTKARTNLQTLPAGTEVYVRSIRRDGTCEIRVPGTLLTQTVRLDLIAVP